MFGAWTLTWKVAGLIILLIAIGTGSWWWALGGIIMLISDLTIDGKVI